MTTGVIDVQSRIQQIQERLNSISGQATSATSAAFSQTLAKVSGAPTIARESASLLTSADATGQDAVDIAKEWLGTPYVWGGNDPESGLDCSGLIQQAYKRLGVDLPRVAADQARQGTKVDSMADAKPGDLLSFGSPVDHIGIYAGDNKMVVAPRRGDVVKVQDVYKTPVSIRRILPDDTSTGSLHSAASTSLLAGPGAGSSPIASGLRSQYDAAFVSAGAKYNISPNLLAAVAKQESGFNASAKSGAGARGLMQIMPGTAKSLGVDPMNPTQAIDGAAKMLSGLVSKFGSVDLALAGYNAGPGAVQKYGGIPPYKETQHYVKSVLALSKGPAS